MTKKTSGDGEVRTSRDPLRRIQSYPKNPLPFVFFASSADSSYITGEVLTLLGGETTAA